jgi:hypothetical protein
MINEEKKERIKFFKVLKEKARKLGFNDSNADVLLDLYTEEYNKHFTCETPYPAYFASLKESCAAKMETLRIDREKPKKGEIAFIYAQSEFAGCIGDEIKKLNIEMRSDNSESHSGPLKLF